MPWVWLSIQFDVCNNLYIPEVTRQISQPHTYVTSRDSCTAIAGMSPMETQRFTLAYYSQELFGN